MGILSKIMPYTDYNFVKFGLVQGIQVTSGVEGTWTLFSLTVEAWKTKIQTPRWAKGYWG